MLSVLIGHIMIVLILISVREFFTELNRGKVTLTYFVNDGNIDLTTDDNFEVLSAIFIKNSL